MKQKTNAVIILVLLMAFAFIACNQETKNEEPAKTEAIKTETTSMPAYDPAMDPLKVEAALARVFGDTLNVKFYELTIKPGDSVALHSHPDHLVYVVDGGFVELKDKEGNAKAVEFKKGAGLVLGPETHAGRNTGTTTIKLVVADIYRPRS